ncbi:MAG: recombinase family protein, partial [Patescibacteria group bacterium]|nr:recombinase family protein [Patescibacteria group bacterium]
MLNNAKKYFIYARKSTDTEDKQVRSLADQLSELKELARKEQLEVVDTFVEKQTAKVPGRPVFAEMLDRIEHGEASGILAWHPDRLARNSVDGGKVIYLVDTGVIVDLKFPTFWFDATPQGKFMLSIAFGQSKYYVDNLSENIKRSYRQKLKNGILPHQAPLGYLNDKKTKTIVVDPERAPLVRKMFEAYGSGNYTLSGLRKAMGELGLRSHSGRELSISNYQKLLRNPIYHGLIFFGGEFYEGKHEPIITKKLFDQVQEMMEKKSKPQKGGGLKPYVYRGLFKCGECGCSITAETQKGHNYLRCTKRKGNCSQKYVREEAVTNMIKAELEKVSLSDAVADWLMTEIEKEKTSDVDSSKNQVEKVNVEITAIDSKLEKLMAAYLENALTLGEYQTAKNKLVSEKQALKDKLAAFERMSADRFEPVVEFIKDCKQAGILAKSDDKAKIREFFQKVGSNPLLRDRAVIPTIRAPYAFVSEIPKNANNHAGGAAGGVWGGMPPRPQHCDL